MGWGGEDGVAEGGGCRDRWWTVGRCTVVAEHANAGEAAGGGAKGGCAAPSAGEGTGVVGGDYGDNSSSPLFGRGPLPQLRTHRPVWPVPATALKLPATIPFNAPLPPPFPAQRPRHHNHNHVSHDWLQIPQPGSLCTHAALVRVNPQAAAPWACSPTHNWRQHPPPPPAIQRTHPMRTCKGSVQGPRCMRRPPLHNNPPWATYILCTARRCCASSGCTPSPCWRGCSTGHRTCARPRQPRPPPGPHMRRRCAPKRRTATASDLQSKAQQRCVCRLQEARMAQGHEGREKQQHFREAPTPCTARMPLKPYSALPPTAAHPTPNPMQAASSPSVSTSYASVIAWGQRSRAGRAQRRTKA